MKQYTITRIEGQPDWSAIPALNVDHHNWVDPVDIDMTAQICYDDNGLYLHLRGVEQEHRVLNALAVDEVGQRAVQLFAEQAGEVAAVDIQPACQCAEG